MLHRIVQYGVPIGTNLVLSTGTVVVTLILVVAGKQSLVEVESLPYHVRSVGVCLNVLMQDLVVVQQVLRHAAQERDIGALPDRAVEIGDRCGTCEAWID